MTTQVEKDFYNRQILISSVQHDNYRKKYEYISILMIHINSFYRQSCTSMGSISGNPPAFRDFLRSGKK